MLETDLPEFALAGERGIDVFRRIEDQTQRRVRFECVATASDAPGDDAQQGGRRQLIIHDPAAGRQPGRLWQAVERYERDRALHQAFALGQPPGYPSMRDRPSRLALFQALEFLRARLVADITITTFEEKLAQDAARAVRYYAETASVLRLLLDFNMLARARFIATAAAPLIIARALAPGFVEDSDHMTGYALRMLGDLNLRAGQAQPALACFEAALAASDNPFRRRKAIEAAQAAGDLNACRAHLEAFARARPLPPDLAELRKRIASLDNS